MIIQAIILAGIAGWVVDDWCPTPPRPWPGPGPGPWWMRKILAVVGGIVAHLVFQGGVVNETLDAVAIIVVGGIGGAFFASIAGGLMGAGKMDQVRG